MRFACRTETMVLPDHKVGITKQLQGCFNLKANSKVIIKGAGAPNENIVQNRLNIALLNVFYYLNGGFEHIFIPYKFFICADFLAESLVIRKL